MSRQAKDSNVGLYVALGAAVLLVFAAAGWFVVSGNKAAPTPRELPRTELLKPAPLPGRVLVPPEPPKPLPPPEPVEASPAEDAGTPSPVVDAGAVQAPAEEPVVAEPLPPSPQKAVAPVAPVEPPKPAPTPTPQAPVAPKPVARPQAPKKESAPEGGEGFLTLVTTPFARVSVGDRDLGMTPLFKVSLPAGTHTLKLVSEDGAASQLSVTIQEGVVTPVRKNLSGGE